MASINASTSGAGGVITTADNTGILNLQTAGTNAVTINASQNVGIGTTSPLSKFNIKGTQGNWRVDTDSVSNEAQVLSSNAANSAFIDYRTRAAQVMFDTANTERMRIDSSGNVLVGTTTTAGAASNNALVVGGVFNSLNGTTALLANGASASIVTSTASLSFYQVFANCTGNTTVFASALIYFNGVGTATVQSIMGTGMSISSSGANIITVTNSAGSSQQISWTVTRYK